MTKLRFFLILFTITALFTSCMWEEDEFAPIKNATGVDSLESLRQQAIDNGVEFIACQMSMDVMGVKREELLDEVTVGGVATYMDRAEQANVNLFI